MCRTVGCSRMGQISSRKLDKNATIDVDYGSELNGYCAALVVKTLLFEPIITAT